MHLADLRPAYSSIVDRQIYLAERRRLALARGGNPLRLLEHTPVAIWRRPRRLTRHLSRRRAPPRLPVLLPEFLHPSTPLVHTRQVAQEENL